MGQRDDRLLRTAMAEDTLKPGPQRAVLSATRARRRFDQRRTQPAGTVPRFARLMLAGALVVSRTQRGPAREMARRGEGAHIHTDLGDEDFGRPPVDARNAIQSVELVRKRGEAIFDLRAERADSLVEVIEMRQELAHQKRVVRPKPARERRAEGRQLAAQPSARQLR